MCGMSSSSRGKLTLLVLPASLATIGISPKLSDAVGMRFCRTERLSLCRRQSCLGFSPSQRTPWRIIVGYDYYLTIQSGWRLKSQRSKKNHIQSRNLLSSLRIAIRSSLPALNSTIGMIRPYCLSFRPFTGLISPSFLPLPLPPVPGLRCIKGGCVLFSCLLHSHPPRTPPLS